MYYREIRYCDYRELSPGPTSPARPQLRPKTGKFAPGEHTLPNRPRGGGRICIYIYIYI